MPLTDLPGILSVISVLSVVRGVRVAVALRCPTLFGGFLALCRLIGQDRTQPMTLALDLHGSCTDNTDEPFVLAYVPHIRS